MRQDQVSDLDMSASGMREFSMLWEKVIASKKVQERCSLFVFRM